jgi:tetratricopeptide (TPR) repeat protein
MIQELTINFDSADSFTISFNHQTTASLPFTSPIVVEDWQDIQWYLELYPTQYAADVDDARAERVVAKLQVWGQLLFKAVFGQSEAARLFTQFQVVEAEERQLSIAANQPEILRLPWELLCDPQGTFLLHGNSGILMRRQFAGFDGGKLPISIKPKETLRLLMVVSRPEELRLIDPRAEGQSVIKAIDQAAPGRIVVEFLRPATLKKLHERLKNDDLPAVDIVHFDGHGVFSIDDKNPQGMGYLLFEDQGSKLDKISAEMLGDILQEKRVSLVMLSACESAKLATEADALGCVAARLIHCGIPAVLAMTYSVLTTTTEQLFGKFYGKLAKGESMGTALAIARQDLEQRRDRGLRWRGREQITLNLSDWFLPAFYQAGNDVQLLNKREMAEPPEMKVEVPWSRFSEVAKEGFFGRSQELWKIEQLFARNRRRFTISGFGGQGKTYLALEAGRWLYQTGMFDVLCFVDYASFQGVEPVDWAVAELSVALGQSFVDIDAVNLGLQKQKTLMILDNLESLQPEALQGLLTVASRWSEVGGTRLLLTTRDEQLNHPDYPIGRNKYLLLKGLGSEEYPEDAINYFQELMKLPPEPTWDLPSRSELINLFKLVDFHPLSIRSVAYQCKSRRVDDLEQNLKQLLTEVLEETSEQRSLIASLNLSLLQLDQELLEVLPKLGVFQNMAFESQILEISGFSVEQWQCLILVLKRIGLVQIETLTDVESPFLRFHPTLSSVVWRNLSVEQQIPLKTKYQYHYYILARYLYEEDSQDPAWARSIALKELSNLLQAVKESLAQKLDYAMEFFTCVIKFLENFGLHNDKKNLIDYFDNLINENSIGSDNWYLMLSIQGRQLFQIGDYDKAAEIFIKILQDFSVTPSINRINTLVELGRCRRFKGLFPESLQCLQKAINLSQQLEQNDKVKQQWSGIQTDLGGVLTDLGEFNEARQAYEQALSVDQDLGDQRGIANVKAQLGSLAMEEGNLITAAELQMEALKIFKKIKDPVQEAMAWHQLGMIYQEDQQWLKADNAYRESAQIKEEQGDTPRAANTYGQLGILNVILDKPKEAEGWYRKALDGYKLVKDKLGESRQLNNLAHLLSTQPSRVSASQTLLTIRL